MEHFRIDHGDMFSKYDIGRLSASRDKQVANTVAKLADEYVLNVNEADYIRYLIDEYTLQMPILCFDDVKVEHRKVLVDPEYLPRYYGAQNAVECNMIRYIVPLSGDHNLLLFCPSTFTLSGGGNFHVERNEIYTDILAVSNDAEKVTRDFNSRKDNCLQMLAYLENDVRSYNRSLPDTAKRCFLARKEKIKKDNAFLANLGVPTSSHVESPQTYAVPTVSHRFAPPKVDAIKKVESMTPVMDMEKYEQILMALQTAGQMYERFPNLTLGKDEETLRDLFLTQIQISFKNDSATAEAFNKRGKTDIMLKHGDGILFIAECKFWNGKQVFHDAITQVLKYLTWRDTKVALLIFVRKTTMTTAVNSIKESVSSHENYKCTLMPRGETWLNYKFTMLNDKEREVYLAVQIFDFSQS